MMLRTLLMAFTTVTLLLGVVGPAAAQYPPVSDDGVVISDTTVFPGQVVTVSGSGWLPGSTVTLTLYSDPVELGTATVEDDGTFTIDVVIPEVSPGTHTLEIRGTDDSGEPRVEELTIEVLAPGAGLDDAAATADMGLAFTGAHTAVGVALAAALLLTGGVTLLVARRRRRRLALH